MRRAGTNMTETSVASASAQQLTAARLPAQRRPREHPQRGCRRVSGRVRASRGARDRHAVSASRSTRSARPARHAAHEAPVHLIGFPGCYPNGLRGENARAADPHPNVGAVLFVSLGCESMNKHYLVDVVRASGPSSSADHPGERRHAQHDSVRWRRLGSRRAGQLPPRSRRCR